MTLGNILQKINRDIPLISYRTFVTVNGKDEDIFAGICEWVNNSLNSLDGDSYSLDDDIGAYNYDKQNNILTVWYSSSWIGGK